MSDRSALKQREDGRDESLSKSSDPAPPSSDFENRFRFRSETVLFAALFAIYAAFFLVNLAPYWFNPRYTTDDSLQQLFPFYTLLYPGIFEGDIVTEAMRGYLAPLHYAITAAFTLITRDPNIAGHAVMVVQLGLTLVFLFLAVRRVAGTPAAFFSCFWLLHTRNLVQRMTCGLPRGWAGFILCAYLYFILSKNHRGVLITLLLGCLLNPPATMVAAAGYGLVILYRLARRDTRAEYRRPAIIFFALCPLYIAVTLWVVHRPPEIGTIYTLKQASEMPGFSRQGGRFAFLPFKSPLTEIRTVGMQAFVNKWYEGSGLLREDMVWLVAAAFVLLLIVSGVKKRELFPPELLLFLFAAFSVYFASRILAFRLYVPDRHLQFPLNIFSIVAFPIALWRLAPWISKRRFSAASTLLGFGVLLFFLGGTGLDGVANFNTRMDMRGELYPWIRTNTPSDSLIAGHPSHLDGLQLIGIRKGYITTETAHPFYDHYYGEVQRRVENTFRAYYATDWHKFLEICNREGIDYFVFRNSDFLRENLRKAGYDKPFKVMVHRLAKLRPEQYPFSTLPSVVDLEKSPFMPYRDAESTVIDIRSLEKFLRVNQAESSVVKPDSQLSNHLEKGQARS